MNATDVHQYDESAPTCADEVPEMSCKNGECDCPCGIPCTCGHCCGCCGANCGPHWSDCLAISPIPRWTVLWPGVYEATLAELSQEDWFIRTMCWQRARDAA